MYCFFIVYNTEVAFTYLFSVGFPWTFCEVLSNVIGHLHIANQFIKNTFIYIYNILSFFQFMAPIVLRFST